MKIAKPGKPKNPKQRSLYGDYQSNVLHSYYTDNNNSHKNKLPDTLSGNERPFFQNLSVVEQWIYCYQILEDSTPLANDCGVYCSAKCCSGGPNEGMLLFPGEEHIYETMDVEDIDEFTIKSSNIALPSTQLEVKFLICKGTCNRKLRPMSCRIFPLLP